MARTQGIAMIPTIETSLIPTTGHFGPGKSHCLSLILGFFKIGECFDGA